MEIFKSVICRSAVTRQWPTFPYNREFWREKNARIPRNVVCRATSSGVPRRAPSKVSATKLKISWFEVLFYKVSSHPLSALYKVISLQQCPETLIRVDIVFDCAFVIFWRVLLLSYKELWWTSSKKVSHGPRSWKSGRFCLLRRMVKCPFRINGIICLNGILINKWWLKWWQISFHSFWIIFLNVMIK